MDGPGSRSLPTRDEPTVIAITRLADTPSPLTTDLDTYPLNYLFDKSSATDAPFTQLVTVAVCPASGIDPAIESRLQLGHQDEVDGFEVLPPAPATFLDCSSAPPASRPAGGNGRGHGSTARRRQHNCWPSTDAVAWVARDSFSPLLQWTGTDRARGLAGLPTRSGAGFQRRRMHRHRGPMAHPSAACRPTMTFTTFLGTQLDGIPVGFSVEAVAARLRTGEPLMPGVLGRRRRSHLGGERVYGTWDSRRERTPWWRLPVMEAMRCRRRTSSTVGPTAWHSRPPAPCASATRTRPRRSASLSSRRRAPSWQDAIDHRSSARQER
jgi:hypothetical protein